MALETSITEVPLTQGQDEGTQVEVLPIGRLRSLQNARFRRLGRLGKRNGYRTLASVDAAGSPLGNGHGRLTALGPRFCAVDDRFYRWDDTAGAWGYPSLPGGALDESRLLNRWPQFTPAPAFSPASEESPLDLYSSGPVVGTLLQSIGGLTYAQGLVWTSWCWWANTPTIAAWTVTVTATDPTSKLEVFRQSIPLSGAQTDNQQPCLLSTGNGTVVLVTDTFAAGAKTGLSLMLLTNRAAGFSPGVTYAVACLESAVNYYNGSSTEILIAYSTGTTDVRIGRWSVTTQSFAATGIRPTFGEGVPAKLACYGISGGSTWVSYMGSIGLRLRIDIFDAALVSVIGNIPHLAGAQGPAPFVRIPGTSPLEVFCVATTSTGLALFSYSGTGAGSSQYPMTAMQPVSQPFEVDGRCYCWVRHTADPELGVATLIRLPQQAEYEFIFRAAAPPIEASLDDEDIDPLLPASSGPPFPTPIATPLGYLALLSPTVRSVVGPGPTTYFIRRPLVVPLRHRSEGVLFSTGAILPVCGKFFAAGALPMFVDARGDVEAGFVSSPVQPVEIARLGGGGLTASSVYQYTAYFECLDSNGLIERSAPATPLVMTLGAGETRTRVQFASLELTKKLVRLRIFRTLGNQPEYFELISLDVTPCVNSSGTITIEDAATDLVVGSNTPLYTQLGSEFENGQFPACRFGMVAAGRLWLAGGFRGNVVTASKTFIPGRSVEFVADDAFRPTLPEDCTGLAYLDTAVAFTAEGIYLVSGDGPDVAGVGAFTTPTRLPFNIGCTNPRSVLTIDAGVFFESPRGLCLLPRGFSEPIPQDQVIDTLAAFPHIMASGLVNTGDERTAQWVALADDGDGNPDESVPGVVLIYDIEDKAWIVDTFQADKAAAFITTRDSQRLLGAADTLIGPSGAGSWHPFRLQNTGFADGNADGGQLPISMLVATGDMRLWGTFAHGLINRVGLLGVLRTACTLSITKTTDRGVRATTRGYTAAAPDYVPGDTTYLEVKLGGEEQRDITALRFSIREVSTVEGAWLIGLVLEADNKPQGFRLLKEGDRVN